MEPKDIPDDALLEAMKSWNYVLHQNVLGWNDELLEVRERWLKAKEADEIERLRADLRATVTAYNGLRDSVARLGNTYQPLGSVERQGNDDAGR